MRTLTTALCVLALSACASDEPAKEPEGDPLVDVEACPEGTPDTFIGMTAEGPAGALIAKLVEAELPATKGFNTWTVAFTDADGEPLDDVELGVDDFMGVMPAHQHDTNHEPVIESLGEGQFELSEINLHMDGQWVLTFSPRSESLGTDDMTFVLCTEASIAATQ